MTIDDVILEIKEKLKDAEHMYSVYYTMGNMLMVGKCQVEIELYKNFLGYLETLKESK